MAPTQKSVLTPAELYSETNIKYRNIDTIPRSRAQTFTEKEDSLSKKHLNYWDFLAAIKKNRNLLSLRRYNKDDNIHK